MKLQILVTTMHAKDFSKIEEMNLRNVDVIIANQTDFCCFEEKDFPERNVRATMISTNTSGLGLNRNILLAYSSADIIMFADDDMLFVDNFSSNVLSSFADNPDADAIKFYLESTTKDRPLSFQRPSRIHRAKRRELMSAGVPALAVRRKKVQKVDLHFPTSIGAGRFYGSGEDSIFYRDMFKNKFNVWVSPIFLGYVHQETSTWFSGYDEHYFETAGYVYAKLYGHFAVFYILRRAIKMRKQPELTFGVKKIFNIMKQGAKKYMC